jgi:predicted MFS family arabinose efflux permease
MDRDSLRRLRAQPGYARFVSAATLARVSDEMFGVGVVLLMLDRTGDEALAGAAVAAITLPSLVTAPLLGAWLDLTGRRRALMVIDQIVIASVLVALVALAGHAPTWVIVLTVLPAGLTYPLSFGGFTSMIPSLVPGELLPPANALETTSFNSALVVGPALAGTLSAAVGPTAPLFVEALLALAALALILRIPNLDTRPDRSDGRTLLGIAALGLRQIVAVPQLRGVTAAAAIGLGGLGLLTVAFPLFAVDHLGVDESASGYMWAAFAIGSTFGALTLVRLQRRFPAERIVLAGYALFGALMLSWQLADALPLFLALIAVAAMVDGPALAAQFAVRQQFVPPSLYGQVFTTAVGLKVGCLALGAAASGALVAAIGSAEVLALAAGMQVLAAAVGLTLVLLPGRPGRDAAAPRSAARRA